MSSIQYPLDSISFYLATRHKAEPKSQEYYIYEKVEICVAGWLPNPSVALPSPPGALGNNANHGRSNQLQNFINGSFGKAT